MATTSAGAALIQGQVYSWEALGERFGFEPDYFGVAGGMLSRPRYGALLLITHPGGARSFDYKDYWADGDLIYTGRGKRGDQRLEGPNRDLALNSYTNHVFEAFEARELRYLGDAVAVRYWRARGVGDDGRERAVLRYQLTFRDGGSDRRPSRRGTRLLESERMAPLRSARPFDPSRSPSSYRAPVQRATAEETAALQEKANRDHHALLVRLAESLASSGWINLVEIPGAVDLRAVSPARVTVLFEAKTVGSRSEVARTRGALSQLLEYRHYYGSPSDKLCLVASRPISDLRVRFLESQGIAVAYDSGSGLVACGPLAGSLLADAAATAGAL